MVAALGFRSFIAKIARGFKKGITSGLRPAVAEGSPADQRLDNITGIENLSADILGFFLLAGAKEIEKRMDNRLVYLGEVVGKGGVLHDVPLVIHQEDSVRYKVTGLKTGSDVIDRSVFGNDLVVEGQDDEVIDRFFDIAFFYLLRDDRYRAGACAAASAGDKQEGIRFAEVIRCF